MFDRREESGLPCGVPSERIVSSPSVGIDLCLHVYTRRIYFHAFRTGIGL
jgi:hypothetical protein